MKVLFPPDAAVIVKELVLQGFKLKYIHSVLENRGFCYTKDQVMHRITYVRHQEGLTRTRYSMGERKLPRDHGYHIVDDYVPSHERRARFDPEAHRASRHYQGTFEL